MNRLLSQFLFVVVILFTIFSANADEEKRHRLADSLSNELRYVNTSADSIKILFDIYDLNPPVDMQEALLLEIIGLSEEIGDTASQIAALSQAAIISRTDTMALFALKKHVDMLDNGSKGEEMKLLIDLMLLEERLKHNHSDPQTSLESLLLQYTFNAPEDYRCRIKLLLSICQRISEVSRGDLLVLYEWELEKLIDRSPLPLGMVKFQIYTRSASTFSRNGRSADAVRSDKKIIKLLDQMTESYRKNGRKYSNSDLLRYLSMRRMLVNYKALTDNEIEAYYKEIKKLIKENDYVKILETESHRSRVAYLMATKRYAEAIPEVKEAINSPRNVGHLLWLYSALKEAADATGMEEESMLASTKLSELYRAREDSLSEQRDKELSLMQYANKMRSEYSQALDEERTKTDRQYLWIIGVSVFALLLLCCAVVILVRQNRKNSSLAAKLSETIDKLSTERNSLKEAHEQLEEAHKQVNIADRQKSDFINNMTHEVKTPLSAIYDYSRLIVDCIPEDKRGYLERFVRIIEVNTQLVLSLINDVLDISSVEKGDMIVERTPTTVKELCESAIEMAFNGPVPRKRGIVLDYNIDNKEDIQMMTDPKRAQQVIAHLLRNAEKFTESGSIDIAYQLTEDKTGVEIIVTDTGIGIPESQKEVIFNRFKQLDSSVSGCGLGLYVSRLLAQLLGGSIRVDSDYHRGARFIFTLPL